MTPLGRGCELDLAGAQHINPKGFMPFVKNNLTRLVQKTMKQFLKCGRIWFSCPTDGATRTLRAFMAFSRVWTHSTAHEEYPLKFI
jgi:hypothetical protein